jgi:hypothetical protein
VTKIVDAVKAKPDLWSSTAIFITTDEGGGYYDSGYVQPLDFFGDGTRIPLIAVSPYTKPGHISHTYADHVSILKFIERNWDLDPITARSRDNLPNPKPVPGRRTALRLATCSICSSSMMLPRSKTPLQNVRTSARVVAQAFLPVFRVCFKAEKHRQECLWYKIFVSLRAATILGGP